MAVEFGEAHVGQGVPAFNHEGVEDETEFERRAVVRDVVDSQGFVIRTTYKCVILPIDAGYSENVAFQGRLMSYLACFVIEFENIYLLIFRAGRDVC